LINKEERKNKGSG